MMDDPTFLKSIQLDGFLSFAPDSAPIDLTPLNVLIGPNGSGKSNLIEAVGLLHAAPMSFAAAIRDGGGVQEWLWKGDKSNRPATIEAVVQGTKPIPDLRYRLTFAASLCLG
jgi:predicted ATPase